MLASTLQRMPVVSLADGTNLGTVADVLFESGTTRIASLLLAMASGQAILPFGVIRSIGTDAITVEQVVVTQSLGGAPLPTNLRGLSALLGLKVVNSDGTLLGSVEEIDVASETGEVVTLTVRRGGVLGIGATTTDVPAAAIRSFGPDLCTVELVETDAGAPPDEPPH